MSDIIVELNTEISELELYGETERVCLLRRARDAVYALRQECSAEKQRNEHLQRWKQSALETTPDYQAIAKEMDLPLGTNVPAAILPWIQQAKAKLEYVDKMGLRFGKMRSSDRPDWYLMHTWDLGSDHERMFREWTHMIGVDQENTKLKARITMLELQKEPLLDVNAICNERDARTVELMEIANLVNAHTATGNEHETYTLKQMVQNIITARDYLHRQVDLARGEVNRLVNCIQQAIGYAGNRVDEWGDRAVEAFDILERGLRDSHTPAPTKEATSDKG